MRRHPLVVGVVIARAGSKGVPGKNMARVGGRPLLAHTLLAARHARTLDRILLSTDSQEMADLGKRLGVEVPFLRPVRLAKDRTHTPPVIEHAVSFLERRDGISVDIVVTLQATSPFRRSMHIDLAVRRLLRDPSLDSVIGVRPVSFPPFWMLKVTRGIARPFVANGVDYSLKERQQLAPIYQPNGAVCVTRRWLLKKRGVVFSAFSGGKTGCLIMDDVSSMDIDHRQDLAAVRQMAREYPELLR